MSDGMEEIIEEFVTEAQESLEKIDPLFVQLEVSGGMPDKDILNDIFRSMHTIKGAAGFLGFQSIVDVAHRAESIMKKLRENEIDISTSLISVILKSVDMLRSLLNHIKTHDGVEEDATWLMTELDEALANAPAAGTAARLAEEAANAAQAEVHTDAPTAEEELLSDIPVADEHTDEPAVAQVASAPQRPEIPHAPGAAGATKAPQQAQQGGQPVAGDTQTLRVDVTRIDKVMNLTGEIVLVRNRLLNIANYLDAKYSGDNHVDGLQEAVSFLDLVTSDIQLAVMKMRMQQIKKVFSKFPRLVRDLSQSLGKDVELNISGETTEVDRTVIERIGDPMVHIIRNAIDHGLERREDRIKTGKPEKGIVDISAYQKGNQIVIEVSDDGKGMDIERIKKKAIERGLLNAEDAAKISDKEALDMVFLPGFSTVEVATELSGRGVGMDVVKTNISKLNGYVEIFTTKGTGTTFRISIPLTLAIIQALMVRTAGVQYAIPLAPIEETLKVSRDKIDHVTGTRVLAIRGKVFPLAELTDVLGSPTFEEAQSRYVLVISIGDKRFCVCVDELLGQEEVVIKSIDGIDTDATGILGATITGDGKVVLILDPTSMAKRFSGAGAS